MTRGCRPILFARRTGEAWSYKASGDGAHETFLSPVLADPIEVGATLAHELVHHAVGVQHGHRGPFAQAARVVGLEGRLTATTAGPALRSRLAGIVETIGAYPHATLDATTGRKNQGTRMLKVVCSACGCTLRMTQKWLDDVGEPTCGCGGTMSR